MRKTAAFYLLVLIATPALAQPAAESLHLPQGVHAARSLSEVADPVLRRFYPRLRFYTSEHDTDFHEYMHVRALTIVEQGHAPVTAVEYLFSHAPWQAVLDRLQGARITSRSDAEALLLALARMLAPLAHPVRHEVGAPEISESAARVRLSADNGWEVWLELQIGEHRVRGAALAQHHVPPN